MFQLSKQTRRTRYLAILASLLTCIVVSSASTRRQSSSGETIATNAETQSKGHSTTARKSTSARLPATRSSSHKRGSTSSSSKTASAIHHSSRRASRKSRSKRVRGQQKIDSDRATSIQEALIREHYLSGEPSGAWDSATEAAMRKYQSDQGWQTKQVPDSRALIKLGLGPNNDHLLNPDSAMTSTPIARRSDVPSAGSHTSDVPAANDGNARPFAKPVSAPQSTPAPQPAPPTPPKDSDTSENPQ
jgi:hypothetical protein